MTRMTSRRRTRRRRQIMLLKINLLKKKPRMKANGE